MPASSAQPAAASVFYPLYFLVDTASLPEPERVWEALESLAVKGAEGDASNNDLLVLDRDGIGAPVAKAGDKSKKKAAPKAKRFSGFEPLC